VTAHTTIEEARGVGDIIGLNWRRYDVEQFRIEMDVEREHGSCDPHTGVSRDDPLITGMKALAHMKECPLSESPPAAAPPR
jgi:hypothetical protein